MLSTLSTRYVKIFSPYRYSRQRTFVLPKNRNEHGHLALVSSVAVVEEQSSIMSSWHRFGKGSKAGKFSTLQPPRYSEGHYSLTRGLRIYATVQNWIDKKESITQPRNTWMTPRGSEGLSWWAVSSVPNEWMRLKIVRRWEISQTLPLLSVHWSGAVEPSTGGVLPRAANEPSRSLSVPENGPY